MEGHCRGSDQEIWGAGSVVRETSGELANGPEAESDADAPSTRAANRGNHKPRSSDGQRDEKRERA
jgi:hypothetical protein